VRGGLGRSAVLFALLFGSVGVASALQRVSQARTPTAIATERRTELRSIRSQVNACLATQDRVELRFQSLTRQTRGLRDELDYLESLDPRGVPSDRYDRYLDLVEAFNASIPEWERQAVDLRLHEARCRTLIELHNVHADSLQRFLVGHGIWDEAWFVSEPLDELEPGEGMGEGDDHREMLEQVEEASVDP